MCEDETQCLVVYNCWAMWKGRDREQLRRYLSRRQKNVKYATQISTQVDLTVRIGRNSVCRKCFFLVSIAAEFEFVGR